MGNARYATIDIGTNAVLLLVAERGADGRFEPRADRTEITRLGRGVDATRTLAPEAVAATVEVVAGYAREARALGAERIACVATSAARDATNGAAFFGALREQAGLEAEVISGDEEARLVHLAAERDFGPGPKVVLDIGGGSTEFVYSQGGELTFRRSFDLGTVRLFERHVRHDPATAEELRAIMDELDAAFRTLPRPPQGARLVGVAGTVTTVYSIIHGVEPYDPARVHGQSLSLAQVDAAWSCLWKRSQAQRLAIPGLNPKRADVIPVGALILARAMDHLHADAVLVSDRGVRWGLLYARFGAGAA